MRMAKLLGGFAGILAALALVAKVLEIAPRDLYLRDTYILLVFCNVLVLAALNIAILAVLHFALSRRSVQPPNRIVDLVRFTLIVGSLPVTLWAYDLAPTESSSRRLAIFGATFCFLLGLLAVAVNLAWAWAWTIFRKVRGTHLSHPSGPHSVI
jgi:hypothetical protein